MTFTKEFCAKAIFLEDEDVIYTSDQANISYPVRFPVVVVPLAATYSLVELADKLRMVEGYRPIYPTPETPDADPDGWHDFFIGVNGWSQSGEAPCVDNCISFVLVNSASEADEHEYRIDLDEEEQRSVFERVDAERRAYEWAHDALSWYINTDRASAPWCAAFCKADPKKLMKHAAKFSGTHEGCIKEATKYLRRHYGLCLMEVEIP